MTASAATARIEVVDHGIGIPVDQQPILFERHFRGRNAPHGSRPPASASASTSAAPSSSATAAGSSSSSIRPRLVLFVVELPLAPPARGLGDMP